MTSTARAPLAVTRRGMVVTLAALALGSIVGVARRGADALSRVRPSPSGTSATRCAQCGSPDHTMLDRRCPAAPRVL